MRGNRVQWIEPRTGNQQTWVLVLPLSCSVASGSHLTSLCLSFLLMEQGLIIPLHHCKALWDPLPNSAMSQIPKRAQHPQMGPHFQKKLCSYFNTKIRGQIFKISQCVWGFGNLAPVSVSIWQLSSFHTLTHYGGMHLESWSLRTICKYGDRQV